MIIYCAMSLQPEVATHIDEPIIETEAIHASASAALGDMSTLSSEEATPDTGEYGLVMLIIIFSETASFLFELLCLEKLKVEEKGC